MISHMGCTKKMAGYHFLRRVKKPTTIGIAKLISEKQNRTIAKSGGSGSDGPLRVRSSAAPDIPRMPQKQRQKLGQVQRNTVLIVAMKPTVFLSMEVSYGL